MPDQALEKAESANTNANLDITEINRIITESGWLGIEISTSYSSSNKQLTLTIPVFDVNSVSIDSATVIFHKVNSNPNIKAYYNKGKLTIIGNVGSDSCTVQADPAKRINSLMVVQSYVDSLTQHSYVYKSAIEAGYSKYVGGIRSATGILVLSGFYTETTGNTSTSHPLPIYIQ